MAQRKELKSNNNQSKSSKSTSLLKIKINELSQQIDDLTQALKRERADAINSQQIAAQRMQQTRLQTRFELLLDLLPLLDNLDRAFADPPSNLKEDSWVKGILLIAQMQQKYLKDLNITPIVTVGQPFDHATMEAVATVVDENKSDNLVSQEVLKGYLYEDQVLRPAQVKVVKNN